MISRKRRVALDPPVITRSRSHATARAKSRAGPTLVDVRDGRQQLTARLDSRHVANPLIADCRQMVATSSRSTFQLRRNCRLYSSALATTTTCSCTCSVDRITMATCTQTCVKSIFLIWTGKPTWRKGVQNDVQIYLRPRVTLIFDLLTLNVDHFMPLSRRPLMPMTSESAHLCSPVW